MIPITTAGLGYQGSDVHRPVYQGWHIRPAKVPPRLKPLRPLTRAPSLVEFSISVAAVCADAVRAWSISLVLDGEFGGGDYKASEIFRK